MQVKDRGEAHERYRNALTREVPRKMIYFLRRRYDDRAIVESTKEEERKREQRKMREFPVETT